jgi:hypothetical protein
MPFSHSLHVKFQVNGLLQDLFATYRLDGLEAVAAATQSYAESGGLVPIRRSSSDSTDPTLNRWINGKQVALIPRKNETNIISWDDRVLSVRVSCDVVGYSVRSPANQYQKRPNPAPIDGSTSSPSSTLVSVPLLDAKNYTFHPTYLLGDMGNDVTWSRSGLPNTTVQDFLCDTGYCMDRSTQISYACNASASWITGRFRRANSTTASTSNDSYYVEHLSTTSEIDASAVLTKLRSTFSWWISLPLWSWKSRAARYLDASAYYYQLSEEVLARDFEVMMAYMILASNLRPNTFDVQLFNIPAGCAGSSGSGGSSFGFAVANTPSFMNWETPSIVERGLETVAIRYHPILITAVIALVLLPCWLIFDACMSQRWFGQAKSDEFKRDHQGNIFALVSGTEMLRFLLESFLNLAGHTYDGEGWQDGTTDGDLVKTSNIRLRVVQNHDDQSLSFRLST